MICSPRREPDIIGRDPPTSQRSWRSAAGYRWQHGDLIVRCDRIVNVGDVAIHPHLARREHVGEGTSVAEDAVTKHLGDRVPVDLVVSNAGRFTSGSEQQESRHSRYPASSRGRARLSVFKTMTRTLSPIANPSPSGTITRTFAPAIALTR